MKIVVTGGDGYIGRRLVSRLNELEHQVSIVDIKRGSDIREKMDKQFNGAGACIHLAAISDIPKTFERPRPSLSVNVDGTLNVLEYCRKYDVPKFVFASSAAVYEESEDMINENSPINPKTPYAIHKLAGEFYTDMYRNVFGLQTVSLRLFNVVGGDLNKGLIFNIREDLKLGRHPYINGDGQQTRDFIHLDDVVDAFVKTLGTSQTGPFNIGTGKKYVVNDVVSYLIQQSGKNTFPRYGPAIPEIKHSSSDSNKAHRLLEWMPKKVGLEYV